MQPGAGGAHPAGVHPPGLSAAGAADHPRPVGAPPDAPGHPRAARRHRSGAARRPVPLPAGHRRPGRRAGRRSAHAGGDRAARDPAHGQRPVHLGQSRQRPALSRPQEDRRLRRPDREARRDPRRRAARPLLLRGAQARAGVHRRDLRQRLPDLGARTGVARAPRGAARLPVLRGAQRALHRGPAAGFLPVLHPAACPAALPGPAAPGRGVVSAHRSGRCPPARAQELRCGPRPGVPRVRTREGGVPGEGGRLPAALDQLAAGTDARGVRGHLPGTDQVPHGMGQGGPGRAGRNRRAGQRARPGERRGVRGPGRPLRERGAGVSRLRGLPHHGEPAAGGGRRAAVDRRGRHRRRRREDAARREGPRRPGAA